MVTFSFTVRPGSTVAGSATSPLPSLNVRFDVVKPTSFMGWLPVLVTCDSRTSVLVLGSYVAPRPFPCTNLKDSGSRGGVILKISWGVLGGHAQFMYSTPTPRGTPRTTTL